jgi:hypothetical protein
LILIVATALPAIILVAFMLVALAMPVSMIVVMVVIRKCGT